MKPPTKAFIRKTVKARLGVAHPLYMERVFNSAHETDIVRSILLGRRVQVYCGTPCCIAGECLTAFPDLCRSVVAANPVIFKAILALRRL